MTIEIPEAAQAELRKAVEDALSPIQPLMVRTPDLSALGDLKGQAVETLDTVIAAVNTILQYKFLVPDQYEAPLKTLATALTKVRSWID